MSLSELTVNVPTSMSHPAEKAAHFQSKERGSTMHTLAHKRNATQHTEIGESGKPGRALPGQGPDVHSILHLQRTIGNQAAQRLLQPKTEDLEASSASGASTGFAHDFSRMPVLARGHRNIQPKLNVTAQGDKYEQEADRVADQVLQQQIPEEEAAQKVDAQAGELQRVARGEYQVSEPFENRLIRPNHTGTPTSKDMRAFFEPRIQSDPSKDEVHSKLVSVSAMEQLSSVSHTIWIGR